MLSLQSTPSRLLILSLPRFPWWLPRPIFRQMLLILIKLWYFTSSILNWIPSYSTPCCTVCIFIQSLYLCLITVVHRHLHWNSCCFVGEYDLWGDYVNSVLQAELNDTVMDKSRPTGRAMVVIIILLYVATTIAFAFSWSYIRSMFVDHGQSFWTKYMLYQNPGAGITIGAVTAGAFCTVLADSTMVCPVRFCSRFHLSLLFQTVGLALLDGLGTTVADRSASSAFSCFSYG